jgi:hypothetical protein
MALGHVVRCFGIAPCWRVLRRLEMHRLVGKHCLGHRAKTRFEKSRELGCALCRDLDGSFLVPQRGNGKACRNTATLSKSLARLRRSLLLEIASVDFSSR